MDKRTGMYLLALSGSATVIVTGGEPTLMEQFVNTIAVDLPRIWSSFLQNYGIQAGIGVLAGIAFGVGVSQQ